MSPFYDTVLRENEQTVVFTGDCMGDVKYIYTRNMFNLEKRAFPGVGQWKIPQIEPVEYVQGTDWVSFLDAKKKAVKSASCHFYLDDYRFLRVWNNPEQYIPLLSRFAQVLSPDFSLFTDYPKVLQLYNHYRKHWLAAFWQEHGIRVIPTICWSTPDSYSWCFDGEPKESVVSVSSTGCCMSAANKAAFNEGYAAMILALHPSKVIYFGKDILTDDNAFAADVIFVKDQFSDRFGRMNKAEVSNDQV